MPSSNVVNDVVTRTQFLLNDTGGQLWTLTTLLGHIRSAYIWMYNELAKACDVSFEKVSPDQTYVAPATQVAEQDLGPSGSNLLPADLYLPIQLDFRLNATENWVPVDRRDHLTPRVTTPISRLDQWEWRNRTIFVWPASQNGLLRLRYLSLLPVIALGTDPILMDNVLEALSYYTAADAYRRRGQHTQATAMLGSETPPTGAVGFMSQVVAQCVLNDQYTTRRGTRFTQTNYDLGSGGGNSFTG